jgi:hypothetical protein
MTALDVLRTMRESLAMLLQLQPEELRSLFAAGYSTDPPNELSPADTRTVGIGRPGMDC